MLLMIRKDQAEAIGFKNLQRYFGNRDSWGYASSQSIDLAPMKPADLDALEALLTRANQAGKVRGCGLLLKDIQTWRVAATNSKAGQLKARTLHQLETLLQQYLLHAAKHWVFEYDEGRWLPYYVDDIDYYPPSERNDSPAFVSMDLWHEELGGRHSRTIRFNADDARGKTVAQIVQQKGLVPATPELLAAHAADVARWHELIPQVGLQCLATGYGTDDVDGNPKISRRDSWYWSRTNSHNLEASGGPGRVVVDVFNEDTEKDHGRANAPSSWFWEGVRKRKPKTEDDDEDGLDEDLTLEGGEDVPELPVHPNLVVFDFARHLRLRVHCRQLTEYQYDQQLADKLVLDDDRKNLVKLLIEAKGGTFMDIVKGKGGGAVILLAGPPGTGKTLTAEVFAEAESRPLYSVQCSQLGTDPDSLEDELLKVFTRGKRWKAVMLLDEADVYVHERGIDLQQNAIVGVFLRVLEYQDTVLFLTTNRPDDVDDAIASRCIARLNYSTPDDAAQRRIWRVLADVSGIPLSDDTIRILVDENPGLSGRDVKNLIKLARMLGVTPESIRYVRQFQPTGQLPPRSPDRSR